MTGAQESNLEMLAQEAHETVEPDLTKAEASKEIERLQTTTGRCASAAAELVVPKPDLCGTRNMR